MDGKVLGVERRRRWSKDEKARIVEETLAPGAVVSEVARRHGDGAEPALHLAKAGAHGGTSRERRLDLASGRDRREGAGAWIGGGESRRARRRTDDERSPASIEIELGSGNRVRVDNDVDADALRRVLSVLGER